MYKIEDYASIATALILINLFMEQFKESFPKIAKYFPFFKSHIRNLR